MKPHDNYNLVFEENFQGDNLNSEEWEYRVGERLGGLNLKKNVMTRDEKLSIRFDYEEIDGRNVFTGGGIISKRLFGYGYYETKAKLWGETGGLHSSFWSMGMNGGDGITMPKYNTIIELDGYEVDSGRPQSIGSNIHYYIGAHKTIGGVIGAEDFVPVNSSKEEFVFGYEWLPNQINWYLNDVKIRTLRNPLFYGPQNLWLTALGCEEFDQNINTSLLPGYSDWNYFHYYNIDLLGVNLIVNSSFEYNKNKDFEKPYILDLSAPVGWIVDGKDKFASNVFETENAYDGECVLRHYSTKEYSVTTKVEVPFLPKAFYTLEAMVQRSGVGNHYMQVICNNERIGQVLIPVTEVGVWQKVILKDIEVNYGSCVIEFYSDAYAESNLCIDAVSFVQTSGKSNHTDLKLFDENKNKQYLQLDEIIVHPSIEHCGYNEIGEQWGNSGLSGFLNSSRYAPADKNHCAIYRPNKLEEGEYEVSFYKITHAGRAKKVKIELHHKNGIEEQVFSHQEGDSGFINLGWFELNKESYLKYSALSGEEEGYLAPEAVKFERHATKELRSYLDRSILFTKDSNKVLNECVYEKIDKNNTKVRIFDIDGITLVPLYFTATILGASTFNMDEETNEILIFYSDYMIRLKENSDIINVKTKDSKMKSDCMMLYNTLYVPLENLAEAFSKQYYKIDESHCMVFHEKAPKLKQLLSVISTYVMF